MGDVSRPLLPYETLRTEQPAPGVARIVIDRPEARNAQNVRMTYELNHALDAAADDDDVAVIVLAADGPHFSAGHDVRVRESMRDYERVSTWSGFRRPGAEGYMAREQELYLQMCLRWRDLPKVTIAAAQGRTIGGGLMLLWACDLIVATDDATFSDPSVSMGVNGVEYFVHPWELGARKAKELLFTSDAITAAEAASLGMVNHVVASDELTTFTLDLARRIAAKPSFALRLAKSAVNQALDIQGQTSAVNAAMGLQQLAHTHNRLLFDLPIDPGSATARHIEPRSQGS